MTAPVARVAFRGFRGEAVAGVDCARLLDGLGDDLVGSVAQLPGAELAKTKDDKGSRVYRLVADIGRGEEELFVKAFSGARTWQALKERMRDSDKARQRPHHYPLKLLKLLWAPSPARRSFRSAFACEQAGVPVAAHLLWLSRRRGLFREELLVTAGVNPRGGKNAKNYFLLNFPLPCPPGRLAEKRALLDELGRVLRRAQDSGLTFEDFKLHNLVLELGSRPVFRVIDLAEVRERPQPEGWFLRRFLPSVTRPPVLTGLDRLRLARAYLEAGDDRRTPAELCRLVASAAGDDD